jgi:hypothetical protein
MTVPGSVGYPDLKSQGVIPTLYADTVNVKYYASCLLPRITNSKFTGQVKNQGDSVIIPQRPDIDIFDYTRGMDLPTQVPVAPPIELFINRAKAYRFIVDNIDEKQSQIILSQEYIADAVKQMDITINRVFFADVYKYAATANQGVTAGAVSGIYNFGAAGAPLGINKNSVVEWVLQFQAALAEQNATEAKMWVVVPEWVRFILLNSDLKNAMMMGDPKSVLRTGLIGSLDSLDIYSSNLMYNVTDTGKACTYVIGGNQDAITYCAQLAKARSFEAQHTFGWVYDGFTLFDWKVIKPEGLVTSLVYKA